MNDNATPTQRTAEKVEIAIHLDSEVLEQIKHLTNDPSRIIETAIKQWLRGEKQPDEDLTRHLRRNPRTTQGNGMTKIFQSLIGYFPTERLKYFLRSTIDGN